VRRAQYPRPAFVPTDLADVGALARNLAAAGFDAARPALFTCEGIFCYLPLACPRARPPPALRAHRHARPERPARGRRALALLLIYVKLADVGHAGLAVLHELAEQERVLCKMQGWNKRWSRRLRTAQQGRPMPALPPVQHPCRLRARAPGLRASAQLAGLPQEADPPRRAGGRGQRGGADQRRRRGRQPAVPGRGAARAGGGPHQAPPRLDQRPRRARPRPAPRPPSAAKRALDLVVAWRSAMALLWSPHVGDPTSVPLACGRPSRLGACAGRQQGTAPFSRFPLSQLHIPSTWRAQALAARGEPILSGFETAPEDFAAFWGAHGWSVAEQLDARYAAGSATWALLWPCLSCGRGRPSATLGFIGPWQGHRHRTWRFVA